MTTALTSDWSRVGSTKNLRHQAGGGNVRIHNEKLEFKVSCDWWTAGHVTTILTSDWLQVQSRIGSLANVKHRPGGGDKKIFDDKEYARQVSCDWRRSSHVTTVLTSDWSR